MSSYTPRLQNYPISTTGAKHTHRNTAREQSIRLAAERWTLRSRPQRSG